MSQEGTFENESITSSTQTNHSLFRTSVYLFNVKKIFQEGTFENESIACSTQTNHSLFRTNVLSLQRVKHVVSLPF